ncbi:protease SohB [Nevskia soli]|uniref:protease SohB n=1 Tax=Nevskia soli TaxID=418856 RepID=UPI0004A7127C|nr:protease SohB [Nevskia soli]
MHQFLLEYGLFLARTVTWVAAIIVIGIAAANLVRAARQEGGERLEVKNLNQRLRRLADILNQELLGADQLKREHKRLKREDKAREHALEKGGPTRPRLFVLDFHGDLEASRVNALREEISALLQVAQPRDEVLLRLESAGGVVHGYGLAASQLRRIRDHGLRLVVAIDKVAASGGYLMACVAHHVTAAPFAIVGSIGVVGQMPNFNRLLREKHIDYELHTAGEFKRTLTMFGENNDAARAKFREELDETHTLFKSFVAANRPQLSLPQVATGEHWYGTQALELKLIDEVRTSDDYLLQRVKEVDVYELHYRVRRNLRDQIFGALARLSAGTTLPWQRPAGML